MDSPHDACGSRSSARGTPVCSGHSAASTLYAIMSHSLPGLARSSLDQRDSAIHPREKKKKEEEEEEEEKKKKEEEEEERRNSM